MNRNNDPLQTAMGSGQDGVVLSPISAKRLVNAENQELPLILTRDLHKVYEVGQTHVHALRSVSLEISHGEFVTVRGPSGSGKSTFMKIIGCLDRPTKGAYCLAGRDIRLLSSQQLAIIRNRRIGFVFQNFNLLYRASAMRNVELPMIYAGLTKSFREQRARQALHMVGLGTYLTHQPSQLSGGQQ